MTAVTSVNISWGMHNISRPYTHLKILSGPSQSSILFCSWLSITLKMLFDFLANCVSRRINSCPNNCSGHGRCSTANSVAGRVYCECEEYWKGDACDIPYCRDNCGSPDHGYCDLTGEKLCVCNDSWQGKKTEGWILLGNLKLSLVIHSKWGFYWGKLGFMWCSQDGKTGTLAWCYCNGLPAVKTGVECRRDDNREEKDRDSLKCCIWTFRTLFINSWSVHKHSNHWSSKYFVHWCLQL